jgi:predicted RNA-binding protein with PUA-like domain
MTKHYWLMKSEPGAYSIEDLQRDKKTHWDGVRNYQARNFMRDQMKAGDGVIFYHSNASPPGAAGVAEVCSQSYPDATAWDKRSKYFDPKSPKQKPRWFLVDVKYIEKFKRFISLEEIKNDPGLTGVMVAKKGSRLSVQPLSKEHFLRIRQLGHKGYSSGPYAY